MHHDDRVLIDYRTSDDAGVYRLDEGRALVQTVDFFTPIVDDPFAYGQIAAANALSDVYAMGGRPLTALAIAAFPKDAERVDPSSRSSRAGSTSCAKRASRFWAGIRSRIPRSSSATRSPARSIPRRVLANAGARPGDALLLTKPLGTGIIATALKFGRAPLAAIDAATRSMAMLNKAAAGVLERVAPGVVHACTDITGFGLIGHASEVAAASGCSLEINAASVPLLEGARALVPGNVPGGGRTNREHFGRGVSIGQGVDDDVVELFYDPQTSGGLLIAVAQADAAELMAALGAAKVTACRIGRAVVPAAGVRITVL